MGSIAETQRNHSGVENLAAVLAISALAAYFFAHLFLPLPLNQWIGGMVCFTSARVAGGGHFYESPDSLCAATFPYPPGSLFVHYGVTITTGLDPLLATRLLSLALTGIYSFLCIRAAMRLGVSAT